MKKNKIRESGSDKLLQALVITVLVLVLVVVGYPVLYVIACSFSSADAITSGKVFLLPVDATLAGYEFVFNYEQVWIGYKNTVIYTVTGTILTLFVTIIAAYPISKNNYQGRKFVTTVFLVAMLTSAGLIPTFIVRTKLLGLYDNIWAVILPGLLSVNHCFILRTSFKSSIPGELYDAAAIDGASEFQTLVQIAIPLAKATISVIMLYTAVGLWNSYFTAMMYLDNRELFPLQLVLRTILTASQQFETSSITSADMLQQLERGTEQIKYALIVLSTVPVLLLYAIVQKYFEKGVMIGSVKG